MQGISQRASLAILLIGCASASQAGLDQEVDAVLVLTEPPAGVVFEVVSGDGDLLDQAVPAIRRQSAKLRARFKDIPIAVVSHGREQFALQVERVDDHKNLHQEAKVLNLTDNIPVHVCGTHASWRGLGEEDFPDYVDVAPSGPAQIRIYVELGYLLIEVDLD